MKRRNAPATNGVIRPALPATSTLIPKLPAVREFITATAYDDGSARVPGYLTIRNREVAFEVTLYDPDSGTRLPVRGATLDETLALAEKLLGVEDAPWEHDAYLAEQLQKRAKKSRK